VRLGQASAGDIYYLRDNRLLPLATLFKVDAKSPYYHEDQKGSIFYAESWALTHYLMITDRQQNLNRIRDYVMLLVKKQDPVTAAEQAFGNLDQLQKKLSAYIQQGDFMLFTMSTPESVDESEFEIRIVPTADADAVRADVLVYNDREKDAQALLDSTLRDDPKNALAHETMGYLKFREGDVASAKKWYGEAVQLNSQSYLANYYFAAMSLQSGDTDHDADIENSLRTCIKLNPAFSAAYDALAHLYGSRHERLNDAHMLNLQAIHLEPDNLNYRLNAASVLMEEEQYPGAIGVLEAAKHVAKTPEEIAAVESRIEQIKNFQADVEKSRQAPSEVQTVSTQTPATDTRSMTITSSDGRKFVMKPEAGNDAPKYPTEPATGPHHWVKGVLRSVQCSYPKILTLKVDEAGKLISLYQNDFYQIGFTVTNFTPKGDINPCTDIEGLKARVEYAEVSDKSIAGQILSIELSK
jgi:tetratricopeptide (TPR) repeat protein